MVHRGLVYPSMVKELQVTFNIWWWVGCVGDGWFRPLLCVALGGEAETEIYVLNRVVVVAVGEKLIVACPRKEE